jgi:hypothetical protein
MIFKDTVYQFLMDEQPYYLEQSWHLGEGDGYETAARLFSEPGDKEDRILISRLTFDELCNLKEVVDEMFENLLPRYNAEPDIARNLARVYPWLKEKANINPLFGLKETDDK